MRPSLGKRPGLAWEVTGKGAGKKGRSLTLRAWFSAVELVDYGIHLILALGPSVKSFKQSGVARFAF